MICDQRICHELGKIRPYPVSVELMLWNFLTKTCKEGIGIFAKSRARSEEVCPTDIETYPFSVAVATSAFDMS